MRLINNSLTPLIKFGSGKPPKLLPLLISEVRCFYGQAGPWLIGRGRGSWDSLPVLVGTGSTMATGTLELWYIQSNLDIRVDV